MTQLPSKDVDINTDTKIQPLKRHEFWNKEGRMYAQSAIAGFILTAIILACDYFIGDKVNYIVIIGLFIINALISCWYLPRKIAFKACDVRYDPLTDKYLDENNNDLERVYADLLTRLSNTSHKNNHTVATVITVFTSVIMVFFQLNWFAIIAIPVFFFTFIFLAGIITKWPISFEYKFHNLDESRFPLKILPLNTLPQIPDMSYRPMDPRDTFHVGMPGNYYYQSRISHEERQRWYT